MVTRHLPSRPRPAGGYDEAVARIAALQAKDTAEIAPISRLRFMAHGQRAARAVVFFHGYTSSPAQFQRLGEACFALGDNVLIPRVPHHGLADRMTPDQALLTAEELVALADEAVDIAQGLGERVAVAGLSMGGVMAGWAAQERADVERAVLIAPAFGLGPLPAFLTRPATHLALRLPNIYHWWDPWLKDKAPGPVYTYPRVSTHALAQVLRLSAAVRAQARRAPPAARAIALVTNANDDKADNGSARRLAAVWRAHGVSVREHEFPADLLLPHNTIDPNEAGQKVDIVYPVLIGLLRGD